MNTQSEYNENIKLDIKVYYRKSTDEFVAQLDFSANDVSVTSRYTAKTANEARLSLFAGMGRELLSCYYDDSGKF